MGEAAQTLPLEDEALAKVGELATAIGIADAADRDLQGTDPGGPLDMLIAGQRKQWWDRQRDLWQGLLAEWLEWLGSEPSGTAMAIGGIEERRERGAGLGAASDLDVETDIVLKPKPRRRYEITLDITRVRRGTARFVAP